MQIRLVTLLVAVVFTLSLDVFAGEIQDNENITKKPKHEFLDTNIAALVYIQKWVKMGLLEQALDLANETLSKNPKDVPVRFERADIFAKLGNYEKAEKDLDYIAGHFSSWKPRVNVVRQIYLREKLSKKQPASQKEPPNTEQRQEKNTSVSWLMPCSIILGIILIGILGIIMLRRKRG